MTQGLQQWFRTLECLTQEDGKGSQDKKTVCSSHQDSCRQSKEEASNRLWDAGLEDRQVAFGQLCSEKKYTSRTLGDLTSIGLSELSSERQTRQ